VITLTPLGQEALVALTPPAKDEDEEGDKKTSAETGEADGAGKSGDGSTRESPED
jgi:hypothetical protein